MDIRERDKHSTVTEEPSSSPKEIRTWTTSQVIFTTVFVVLVFLTFWLLYSIRLTIFLLFIAILIGIAMRPAVEWLYWRGISRSGGIILIYFLALSLLVGFLTIFVPLFAEQATQLSQNVPIYYSDMRALLVNSGNIILQNIGQQFPPQFFSFFSGQHPTTEEVLDQVALTFLYTNLIFKVILSILTVFILTYYWVQERNLLIRTILHIIPSSVRKMVREVLYLAEVRIGGYIRGQGLLSLTIGFAAFIAYSIIGLPFTLVLAIIAGLMELIPVLGPALGAIPAILVTLSIDPSKAIWVIVATVLIQMTENHLLVPRIMRNSIGVNPIITILSLVAFSSVFGFPGALVAIPAAAIVQLIIDRIVLSSDSIEGTARFREMIMRPLVDESQELNRIEHEMSNQANSPFEEIAEPDQVEIRAFAKELDNLLRRLKNQDEAI